MNDMGSDLGAGDSSTPVGISPIDQQHIEDNAYQSGLDAAWQQYLPTISANNPGGMYVNPVDVNQSKYTGASEVLGSIARNQWTDWKQRYQPQLEQLAGYADSGSLTRQGVELAGNAVQQSFANTLAGQQRRNEGLGISLTPAQQKASERQAGLSLAASKASVQNKARISGQDRDMQILAGGGGLQMVGSK